MTTPNPRILSNDERRDNAEGYGLIARDGCTMYRILAAQDAKTRRATVEEAVNAIERRPSEDIDGDDLANGQSDSIDILRAMLAPPEPEMVEVIRYDSVTGIGNFARTIRIPLADFERYAKGGGK